MVAAGRLPGFAFSAAAAKNKIGEYIKPPFIGAAVNACKSTGARCYFVAVKTFCKYRVPQAATP